MTTFRLATVADDAVIRSLLRDIGMPTWVEMTMEYEPSFFAAKNLVGREWAVLAEDAGKMVGMYTAGILPVHVNGEPEELGYLGGLRVSPDHRRRIRHLREGYASIPKLAPVAGTLPWWFTVVAAENTRARRLLEAGVRGLPAYQVQGDYVTFGLPAARGRRHQLWRSAREGDLQALLAWHNSQAARFQFAPVLAEAVARRIGLDNFYVYEEAHAILGVAALWDQRKFKQIVARRYRRPVKFLVPAYNAFARLFRRIPLPSEGRALEQTFIAFLALADEALPRGTALVQDLLSLCPTPVASLGLHAEHPLCDALRAFKPMRYPARVYAVSFGDRPDLEALPAQPEAALL